MRLFVGLLLTLLLLVDHGVWAEIDHGPEEGYMQAVMYRDYVSNPCVTLSDNSGPLGCRTPQSGVAGHVRRVKDEASYAKALEEASTIPVSGGGLALLLAPSAVTRSLVEKAQANDAVVGILLENHTATNRPASWSPADSFPNRRFGLNGERSDIVWNPVGSNLMNKDLKKPWYSLGAIDSAIIGGQLDASLSSGGAQMGAEFTLQMMATSDAATCLRRNWCQPVGGYSTGGALGTTSLANLKQAPEVVVVVASMDSASLFHSRSPGAVSDMSGVVALLAAFDALSHLHATQKPLRPAVFQWFTAEAWGYTGSKAFVKALLEGSMPFNATSIYALLEAKQVGSHAGGKLFVHNQHPATEPKGAESAILNAAANSHVDVGRSTSSWGLPPSSSMSFLLTNTSIDHAVLTDHNREYTNQYYHSIYDDFDNVDPSLVCKAGTVLANAVASLQGFNRSGLDLAANCSLVQDLLSCLAGTWKCPMMRDYFLGWQFPEFPANYAGVWAPGSISIPAKFVHDLVAERSAAANPAVSKPQPACPESGKPCANDTGRCIRHVCVDLGLSWYIPAWSPGLKWENGWHVVDTSVNNTLPVFVEANWNLLQLRTFSQEDPAVQLVSVLLGLSLTIVMTVICIVAARKFNAIWRVE